MHSINCRTPGRPHIAASHPRFVHQCPRLLQSMRQAVQQTMRQTMRQTSSPFLGLTLTGAWVIGLLASPLALATPSTPQSEAPQPNVTQSSVSQLDSSQSTAGMSPSVTMLPQTVSYQADAAQIRHTYESQLYTLPAFKMGHYGLRMYRQTLDPKYTSAIWVDMARVASRLNRFAAEVHTPEQIAAYAKDRLIEYGQKTDARSLLRFSATAHSPDYVYLGVDLLGAMARANEYGLKHRDDALLRQIIRRYDFRQYATDPNMIIAWSAQLANQVYWLRQLGEQDVVDDFIAAFQRTYPDRNDAGLSDQQYMNKLYGMTHIILAASEYYQYEIDEENFQWIFDYYRANIDTILQRAKEDVIAEIGINFLLAGLDDDPVVAKTRQSIQQAMNRQAGMIPAVDGSTGLVYGEHRNVLAIMLLDWQGVHTAPTIEDQPNVFDGMPYGLIAQ